MSISSQTNNVAKDAAKKMIQELTDYAPHTLLFGMVSTFILLGFLQYTFYMHVFNSVFVAIFIAAIIQVIRFAAGLTSANFFKLGKVFLALLTIGLSTWLTYFESTEIAHISQSISEFISAQGYAKYQGAIEQVLLVVVWVGPVLELFLGLTLGSQRSASTAAEPETQQQTADEIAALKEELVFLRNQMQQAQTTAPTPAAPPTGNVQAPKTKSQSPNPALSNQGHQNGNNGGYLNGNVLNHSNP